MRVLKKPEGLLRLLHELTECSKTVLNGDDHQGATIDEVGEGAMGEAAAASDQGSAVDVDVDRQIRRGGHVLETSL